MEQVWELPGGKYIRKYSPEHPLFDAGTRLWATKYYHEAESSVQLEDAATEQSAAITCRLATCNVSFQSVAAYEEHYDMVHRNICRECSRSFLSLRLLDIHISETHDAFFKILSKKKPMHLIRVHQYPESFSFHQRRNQKKIVKPGKENSSAKQVEGMIPPDVDAETLKKREARKRRRQQKKKKLFGQTKHEDSDMHVDAGAAVQDSSASSNAEATQSEITDVDMAELEENMRELRIPKNIHFGRKRRI
ncbi:Zinc finger protein [Phytophthora cinnamomi]|uniref:Zinc finger protein n=1 Tax=Phytophthora cinnamomi TaxID=4785 RepID=UPI003559F32E|nr:Zinc finger protein [Phytophthora cinnamomi]